MVDKTGDVDLMHLPILACLAKRPMSAREISRQLRLNRNSVYVRLRQLEKMNMAVKRDSDKKWMPLVKLVAEHPREQARVEEDFSLKPTLQPEIPKKKFKPFAPPGTSAQAVKIAQRFNVPAVIWGKEAGVGQVALCDRCNKPTPLKYGGIPICPICSRQDLREK